MLNDSLYSSDKMDWGTPQYLFDALNDEFGFTLDACANDFNHKCPSYYTKEQDALKQSWHGVVWMNPPYGREIVEWMKKAKHEVDVGNAQVVVCLVPVRSDSKWWHNFAMKASEVRLLDQRLEFQGAGNKAPFPAAIVVFSENSVEVQVGTYDVRSARETYGPQATQTE